jgi:hypothetical protein
MGTRGVCLETKRRSAVGRATGAIALVALLALGVCASTASAAPLSMTFTEARANVGVQLADAALFAAPDTAPFDAQIDSGSGSITAGDLMVPDFSTFITEPVNANVTVEFEIGVITGSFNQTTGALSLSGEAGGTLTANGDECIVSTDPAVLTLSTSGNSGGKAPRFGAPFTAGLGGPGAIAGQWPDMTATPVSPEDTATCETVDERIGGPGGIWLKHAGTVVPPPPPPPVCVVPELKGKPLRQARTALRAAHCTVGNVHRPKHKKGSKPRPLVVKSSTPSAGKTLTVDSAVNLRLGPKPRKAHR